MSTVPVEFTPAFIAAASPREAQLYADFLQSGEPYRSLYRTGVHTAAKGGFNHDPSQAPADLPTPGIDLEDEDLYFNTSGAAQAYWKDAELPRPVRDIARLRQDLKTWGYCLIADALSPDQLARMRRRVEDQAEAERLAGLAVWQGSAPRPDEALPRLQFIHCLINKGEQFVQCVEHDPAGVQGGPVIEQLLNETMGRDFLMSSFIAIISQPGNNPQGLHMDQGTAPFHLAEAPFTMNTMFILADTSAKNGGTLVVPGSHRLMADIPPGQPITTPLPPAINLEAPAGTVMMFEGRLLHGTGVNRSNDLRPILVMNSVKPWMRQQEVHLMSTRREVLESASSKLLYRLGALTGYGGVEGAWNGSEYQVVQRLMMDAGTYLRIGELGPDSPPEALGAEYGWRFGDTARRQARHQPATRPEIRTRYEGLEPPWRRPEKPRFPRGS